MFSSILMVKNLRLINKILEKFLVSWILHNVFHASAGPLHPLMCVHSLSTKLMEMMAKAFIHHRSYAFLTLSLAVKGGGNSKHSTISQRSLVDNAISNLNL